MLILYKLAITFYEVAIVIFSTFNEKAKKFRNGRIGWEERLTADFEGNDSIVLWVLEGFIQGEWRVPVISLM